MKRIAMFSAANEGKVPELAGYVNALLDRGFDIWASGGTFDYLKPRTNGKIITDIKDIVGDVILNHRVVTLDRKVFAGVLSRLGNDAETAELQKLIGGVIEVVHMDIYHLAEAIEAEMKKPIHERNWGALVEKIDIGGPAFLRAAGKGLRFVTSHPNDRFADILSAIDVMAQGTQDDLKIKLLRYELAHAAEHVAEKHSQRAQELHGFIISGLKAKLQPTAS